jgi:peptidoglycan/LPS O-acetylase OafA/YrhL
VVGHYFLQPYREQIGAVSPLLGRMCAKFGWGVNLFFVISGFLIGGILLGNADSPGLLRAFYLRRMVRIWPLYYLLVIPIIGAQYGLGAVPGHSIPFWTYLLFLQNFWSSAGYSHLFVAGVLWSIAVEEHFYLLAPLALRRTSERRASCWIGGTILGAMLWRALIQFGAIQFDFGSFLSMADTIAFGLLGAFLIRNHKVRALLAHPKTGRCVIPVILAIVGLMTVEFGPATPRIVLWLVPDFLAICFAALVLLVSVRQDHWLAALLRTRFLTIPGTYCYFLYLFHIPVILNMHDLKETGWITNMIAIRLVAMAVLLAGAAFSWRYIETPLIAWARRRWDYTGRRELL